MSAISIFIEIDFEGNTYYLSNSAVTREQVFYPYLTSVPSLSIGGEGYAVVTTGGVSIIRSEDPTHPFSGDRYYSLIEKAQEIPFRIYIEDEDAPVFIGNIALDKVKEDEFNFLILEEDFEKKLVTPVISKNSGSRRVDVWYLYREFGSSELRLMLAGLLIGQEFNNMDEIIIEKTYKHIGEKYQVTPFAQLIYDDVEDNRYFISDSKTRRVMLVDKDDNSKYITTNDLLNFYNEKDATFYFTTKADILTELGVDLNTPLTSSFTETYVDDDGNVHNTLSLQNPYSALMFYDENGNEKGELFRITNQPSSEFWVGVPNPNPFSFGRIQMRDPVVVFGERNIKSTYLNYDPTPIDTTPVSADAVVDYKKDFVLVNEVPGVQAVPSRNVRVTSANANQLQPNFYPSNQNNSDGRRIWLKAGNNPWDNPYYSAAAGYTNESSAQPLQDGTEIGTSDSYSGVVTTNGGKSNFSYWNGKYYQSGGTFTDRDVNFTIFNNSYFVPIVSNGTLGVTRNYFYTRSGGGSTVIQPVNDGPTNNWSHNWQWIPSSVSSWTGYEYADYPDYRWVRTYIKPHSGASYYMLRWGSEYSGMVSSSSNKYWTGTALTYNGVEYERHTDVEQWESWAPVPGENTGNQVVVIKNSNGVGDRVQFWLNNSIVHWHWGLSTTASSALNINVWGFKITRLEKYGSSYSTVTETGSTGVTVTQDFYRIRYTAENSIRYHKVKRKSGVTSSTGTAYFTWGGAMTAFSGVTETGKTSFTRMEGGRAFTYSKNGSYSVNTTSQKRAAITRYSPGSTTIQPYTYSVVTDSWSKSSTWTYSDVYAWTKEVVGIPYVPEFTYEKSRERIYSRDNNLYQDAAWGVGWAKDRNFNTADSGYYFSQIIVSSGVVSESSDKIKINCSGSFVNGVENAPQKVKFSTVVNALDTTTTDPNDRITSEFYRVYRTDSKKENEEVGIVRINSNKPTITNTSSKIYVIDNLNLSYDSNPNSALISFRCYAGTKIRTIAYQDNSGNSTGWLNENGVNAGFVDSEEREPLPSGTQRMTIIIDHDPDHTFDSYSNNNFGFDLEIHQRILPEMGSTVGFENIYALVGSFEAYISNMHAFYGHYDFIDYGFKQSADLEFDEVTGELGVNTIRNPSLNVNSLDFPIEIYDDGYPLSESDVLLAYSDEEFINIKTNPFGQYAITGESVFGRTVGEFFQNVVCKKLNEEDEKVDLIPDLTRAPYSSMDIEPFKNLPIFQDSEITVIEMARTVATNTNHIFFFKYLSDTGSGKLSRQLVLVDLNHVFNELEPDKEIAESQIVSIDTDYPYPVKAFESTLTRNVSYIASDENGDLTQPTNMKSQSSKYRVDGSGVGKIQNIEVFAETFSEGRKWMRRLAETLQLPICSVNYEGIDREITLGSKVFFTDYMRKLDIEVVVQSMSYNFDQETTTIEGIGRFDEITYRS